MPIQTTADKSRRIARQVINMASYKLSHLHNVLVWGAPLSFTQWSAAEALLLETLAEIRKAKKATALIEAQQKAQAERDSQAIASRIDRMGLGEVHPFLNDALKQVKP